MENKKKKHCNNEEIKEKEECTCECECEESCDCNEEDCCCEVEGCTCEHEECTETTEIDERELLGKRIKDLEEALLRNQA